MIPSLSILIILVTKSCLLFHGIEADPFYDYSICGNVTFSPNSTYQSSLNKLLTALSSNATANKNGFFATSITADSATVYGSFMCRGVVTVDTCSACVSYGANNVSLYCPNNNKKAIIWFDECILRYSDTAISRTLQVHPSITMYNVMNISNPTKLVQFTRTYIEVEIFSQAASDTSGKKFATKEVNFSSTLKLYSLAQCTPDLTEEDCIQCLQAGTANMPQDTKGCRALLPSCIVRYETYPFYFVNSAVAIPPLKSPSQVRPSTPPSGIAAAAGPINKGNKRSSAKVIVRITVPVTLVALLLAATGMSFLLTTKRPGNKPAVNMDLDISTNSFTAAESLQFDLKLIQAATNNFSDANKLGEGGFGAVYRGNLPNGNEIAVKRLSRGSNQGVAEFKNEVALVAKLQHRNLVSLLGFCLAGDEKLLVYEFVPNKSLDHFLFDPDKRVELDWTRRYKIIRGIARGLLYLHEDSRLRIIHRDIKPSNILLDANMTPKISDFGLAKILGIDEARGNTKRVAGTFGYIAPEYVFNGEFSESSDVYSYGVLVLEIISGQKINNFRQSEFPEHLMSYAWKKWKANEALEIMEPGLREGTDSKGEVTRCIHLALLCVQEDVAARPSMSTVVMTLRYHSVSLPQPQNPAFYSRAKTDICKDTKHLPSSINFISVTGVGPR